MMKTISKGCYGVCKLITTNERLCKVWVARGTKTECVSYIIDLANDSHKLGWCSDVQLSLHVFPRNNDACFNVIKYDKNDINVILRIEYQIARYTEKNKSKGSKQLKTKHHD